MWFNLHNLPLFSDLNIQNLCNNLKYRTKLCIRYACPKDFWTKSRQNEATESIQMHHQGKDHTKYLDLI